MLLTDRLTIQIAFWMALAGGPMFLFVGTCEYVDGLRSKMPKRKADGRELVLMGLLLLLTTPVSWWLLETRLS